MSFNLPPPDPQVSFVLKLIEARTQFLQDALKAGAAVGHAHSSYQDFRDRIQALTGT